MVQKWLFKGISPSYLRLLPPASLETEVAAGSPVVSLNEFQEHTLDLQTDLFVSFFITDIVGIVLVQGV